MCSQRAKRAIYSYLAAATAATVEAKYLEISEFVIILSMMSGCVLFFYSYFVHLNICAIWMCKYNSWRVKIMTIKIVRCQIYPWQSVQIARCWILTLFISLQLFSGH